MVLVTSRSAQPEEEPLLCDARWVEESHQKLGIRRYEAVTGTR